jgi:hypothetical protein
VINNARDGFTASSVNIETVSIPRWSSLSTLSHHLEPLIVSRACYHLQSLLPPPELPAPSRDSCHPPELPVASRASYRLQSFLPPPKPSTAFLRSFDRLFHSFLPPPELPAPSRASSHPSELPVASTASYRPQSFLPPPEPSAASFRTLDRLLQSLRPPPELSIVSRASCRLQSTRTIEAGGE